ncbi:MAG: MBL fold metallo-hydrolase [Actinomycetota bacterium]|jgi:L-ascorbate metabolism protein UlaG (beta-lactamase superfamily)|nr:MBL fold metallo-hydrolase [Actinomycetota bacterium]
MPRLLYQGHASFRIQTDRGAIAYIDPFAGEGYTYPADLVIVTHEHPDHNVVSLVTMKEGGRILRVDDLFKKGAYQTYEVARMAIMAVPATNEHHPVTEGVGILLDVDGIMLYFAGDTSYTNFMGKGLFGIDIDYAFLPIDGVHNMGPEEATFCADMIQPRWAVPIHMKPGQLFDREMAERFDYDNRLILEPGEEIGLAEW